MRTFNVDMIPGGSQTAVACNQYEKGDIWVFALYYDGGRYDIPAGATVSITGQKSDGTAFNVPASVSDNTVLVTVTEQMTAAYGKCIAEVLVQSGNTTLYTANFYILVEPAAVQVPLADTTLPLSITAQDGTVYVQSDLEEATEQMITLAAQQQYQQDLASGVAQRVVEQYAGSTLAGSKQTVKSAIDALNSTVASDTNWKSITAHNATVYYKKHNGIVFVTMRGGLKDMTQNAYTVLATLPAGYRPKLEIQFTCNGLGAQTFFFGNVDASGNINIYVTTASTATAYMGFSVSFPAEQ